MFTPMSSWLESVMIALAFCCFTSWRAPARAMSGALPELASAALHAAAQNARPNKIRFISFSRSRCVGSRRGRHGDLRTGIARRRRFDLRGQGGGGEERERQNQPARAAARGAPVIPGLPGKVLPVELHRFPRTANARRQRSSKRGV